jgi:hypothetical protein
MDEGEGQPFLPPDLVNIPASGYVYGSRSPRPSDDSAVNMLGSEPAQDTFIAKAVGNSESAVLGAVTPVTPVAGYTDVVLWWSQYRNSKPPVQRYICLNNTLEGLSQRVEELGNVTTIPNRDAMKVSETVLAVDLNQAWAHKDHVGGSWIKRNLFEIEFPEHGNDLKLFAVLGECWY